MCSWTLVCVLCVFMSHMLVFLHGEVSVNFKSKQHLYVAPGKMLVLEAVVLKNPEDKIDIVTWDRERRSENIRISPGAQAGRISLEKNKLLLRITNVTDEDLGIYKVTVTDGVGHQNQASIEVRMLADPPKASVTQTLECDANSSGTPQWDSPRFSWLVDGALVTNQKALLANGSRLDISQVRGSKYTCVVNSSLGTSTTHYVTSTAILQTSQDDSHCHWGLIVAVTPLAVLLCVVGGVFIRNKLNKRRVRAPQTED